MAEALYSSFADVLSLSQSVKDDLEALLDSQTGFAPRLRQICEEQIADFEDMQAPHEDIELLRLEAHTWGLLQLLMPPRKIEPHPTPSATELLAQNPYTPQSTLAQAIMDSSPLLTELVVVREWLQDTAPPIHHPEANTGYWKFTKHNILQGLRTTGSYRDGLVKEMDPDAPNREEGRTLASDDAGFERAFLQALYYCVRAGRLDEAVDMCRRAHQSWRASSILGSRPLRWSAISLEPKDEDSMAEDEEEAWSGNQNRTLWKFTCTKAALNDSLSDSERLLYAALAPAPETMKVLKQNCKTWEDHLWVQVSIICEEKESMELGRIGGIFWEGDGDLKALEQGVRNVSKLDSEAERKQWEQEAVGALEMLRDVAVVEGPGAEHAYHFSQLHIILNRMDVLLNSFAGSLADDRFQKDTFEYPQLCRFFAHFCLFLQLIDIPTPPLATQTILESYLQVLEEAGQRELIAMYAGALGDNAVERYALFLVSLALNADIAERRLALTRARDHGLDMDRVAIVAAERTIDKAFELIPQPRGQLPSIIAMQPPATEPELFLLRSIEWTTFNETTYGVALEQTNVILRYFLGMGRVQVAASLLDLLPSELADIAVPEEQATEYLHYRQFFVIWESLERVVECQARNVPGLGKDAKAVWLSDYRNLIDQVHEQVVQLLTTEWLVGENDDSGAHPRRSNELVRIRQIYIPELIIRLHFLLFESRQWIPENLKRALQLANIVADSRYKLYQDFVNEDGRRLGEYLGAVRRAFVGGLEKGGSDPFRPVSSM
ncbi:nuclear pore complex protein [Coprinopsis marcescibilis]|uniref:Nuclear pore complex protein n=1 Tax=Coprinopsis marcescibilis TaxID=230819 RepID=A0A5C3KPV2_COPMA|nr:nuclear pore complex protein [Coprinopsis marcescibilis]